MNNKAKISVPLHKVHGWRITCNCGGHVDIGSGGISGAETAYCPECKNVVPLDDILPILKASRNNSIKNHNLSLLIMLDRCDEI